MLSKLLLLLYRLALDHRRKVYAALLVLVPLSALISTRLTISTSQKALLPPDHPVQVEYRRFVAEFGAVDSLIAVVHGDDPQALRPVADRLAEALRAETRWVRNVFYKVDLDLMFDHAPYFAPTDDLRAAREALERHPAMLAHLDELTSLDGALAVIDSLLGQGAAAVDGHAPDAPAAALSPENAGPAVEVLTRFFSEWRAFLDDPTRALPDPIAALMQKGAARDPRAQSGGYVASRDGRMLFLFVQPTDSSDESEFLRPFLTRMREVADGVLAARPVDGGKVAIGFTGAPAHVHTEAETVFDDVATGLTGAVLLIIVIIFVGFRTVRKTLSILVPLACGMILALGVITLTVGRLNLISAAFFAVMFGMSVDFSIYLIRRAEEERGRGASLPEAVRVALTRTGRGVLFGGLTTCAAFFGTSQTDFSGFSELGVTAGIGIFVCLVSVFLLTPALMLSLGVEPRDAALDSVESRFQAPRARRWLKFAGIAIALCFGLSLFALTFVRFDYDALKLLPRGSESTVLQRRMQDESDLSANSAVVMVNSLDEVRRVNARLADNPEVSRVESMADVIPDGQQDKAAELSRMRQALAAGSARLRRAIAGEAGAARTAGQASSANQESNANQATGAAWRHQLQAIEEKVLDAQDLAFAGGARELGVSLDALQQSIAGLREALTKRPVDEVIAGSQAFERALNEVVERALGRIAAWVTATPLTEDKLKPELRARFRSQSGQYVLYVFPKSLVWDVDALDRFMDSLRAVTPVVTGFAATHQVFSRMVVSGFYESMAFAFLAMLLMLIIDLRRPKAIAFAILPLAVGLSLLQGVLALFGVDYNYASVAAYPVLLGYGSDYGLNIVHRWLERPNRTAFIPAFTVGKGVMLSAATSIAGLFSIVFARHKGVSDFGSVLLIGIFACLVTAVFVLPTVIDLMTHPKGSDHDSESDQPPSPRAPARPVDSAPRPAA